jgi:CheY-like chemotaxis protein
MLNSSSAMPVIKKILFIEDNTQFREMFSQLLEKEGFDVRQAPDGVEGLSVAQVEGGFDLIIADLKMPTMDGLEFIKQLKSKPSSKPNGPVIALTSVTQDYIKEEVVRRGAVDVIAKDEAPPQEIVEKIKEIIKANPIRSK